MVLDSSVTAILALQASVVLTGAATLFFAAREIFPSRVATEAEEQARRDQTAATLIRHMGGSVVFVDDDQVMSRLMGALLATDDIRFRHGPSLAAVLPFVPDDTLLITDWRLKEGSGADVIAAYREVHPERPIIVLSAMFPAPIRDGDNIEFIAKPFDPLAFLERVGVLMRDPGA